MACACQNLATAVKNQDMMAGRNVFVHLSAEVIYVLGEPGGLLDLFASHPKGLGLLGQRRPQFVHVHAITMPAPVTTSTIKTTAAVNRNRNEPRTFDRNGLSFVAPIANTTGSGTLRLARVFKLPPQILYRLPVFLCLSMGLAGKDCRCQ